MGVGFQPKAGREPVSDGNHGPPFGELCPHLPVFRQALAQAVQAFGDLFPLETGQFLGPLVHLDARQDAFFGQVSGKPDILGSRLAHGFIEEDHAADILLNPFGREEQFTVGASVLFG